MPVVSDNETAVRLRTATPLARPADRKRECAQDATGTPLCLAGAAAGGTPDNAAVLEPIGYPEPVVTVFGAPDGAGATCGRTAGGKVYCKGYLGVGHAGDGTRDGPVGGPALVAGGMTFASASTSSQHMCGVTAEGAAYCWGYDLFGQVGAGGTAHELCIDSVPSAIPLVACVLRPRRVTVLARP